MHPNTATTFAIAAGQLARTFRPKSTKFTNSATQVAPRFRIHGVDVKAKIIKKKADLTPPSWRKFLTHPAIPEIPRSRLRWLQQCDEFEVRKRKNTAAEMDWEHTPRGYCLYGYLPHVPFNDVPRPGPTWGQLQFAFATYQPPVLPRPGPYVQPIWYPQIIQPLPVAVVAPPPAAAVPPPTQASNPVPLQPPSIAELNAPAPTTTQSTPKRQSYNFHGGLGASYFNNPDSSSSSSASASSSSSSSASTNAPSQAQASEQLGTPPSSSQQPIQTAPANPPAAPPAAPAGKKSWQEPPVVKTPPFTFDKSAYRQRY